MAMSEMARKNKNERKKVLAAEYKAAKRCTSCGKQDERTLAGKIRCQVCYEKQKISKQEYKKRHGKETDKNAEYIKRRKDKLRAELRCVDCGKQDERTLAGNAVCAVCAGKRRIVNARRRAAARKEKEAACRRKTYHIARLFEYPLLVGDYQNGEYVTAETYAKEYYKKRKGERKRAKENQDRP